MIAVLALLLFGNDGIGLTIDKGIFRGAHVKLLSSEIALLGLGGPFGNPKYPEKYIANTYTVLLIKIKEDLSNYEVISKLELSNLNKEKDNGGNQSIFELSADNKFLIVKPEVSAYLHVIKVFKDDLKYASRFEPKLKGETNHLVSVFPSKLLNNYVLTFFTITEEAKFLNTILLCSNDNGKLIPFKKVIISDRINIVNKGCLVGTDTLALITSDKILIMNLVTNQLENVSYNFSFKKVWRTGPRFDVGDCWFKEDSNKQIQVFVAAPFDQINQIEIRKNTGIEFDKKNTKETFGDTRYCPYVCSDSNSLLVCSKFGGDYEVYYYNLRSQKKDRLLYFSINYEEIRSFSTVPGKGVLLVNKNQTVSLVPFYLEN
jgi:hypothetical protein